MLILALILIRIVLIVALRGAWILMGEVEQRSDRLGVARLDPLAYSPHPNASTSHSPTHGSPPTLS